MAQPVPGGVLARQHEGTVWLEHPAQFLGELTQIVPFELADAVLADARAAQRPLRLLPSQIPAINK